MTSPGSQGVSGPYQPAAGPVSAAAASLCVPTAAAGCMRRMIAAVPGQANQLWLRLCPHTHNKKKKKIKKPGGEQWRKTTLMCADANAS